LKPPLRLSPGPGQESVWDYPRPPTLEPTSKRIRVLLDGVVLADSRRALRLLETSHPPNYYLPKEDVDFRVLRTGRGNSCCEWKGQARYLDAHVAGRSVEGVAWVYDRPLLPYTALAGHACFYASRVDEAWVDDERATAQPGGFYGGWVTADVVGPFKGGPGTGGW
jgi:uncharacterized protein (DUF427 family)